MNFTAAEAERYARQIVLRDVGGSGQARLKAAHVTLVGAGGIGCPAAQYLVAGGIGRVTIIDDDAIGLSNLARQVLFTEQDIGQPKAQVAAARLGALNPHVEVVADGRRVSTGDGSRFADSNVVIDGTDSFASRLTVSDACVRAGVPLVSAAVGMFQGQLGVWFGHLPDQPCYRCFVGDAFDADDCDHCAELGVLGAFVGIVGSMAALEAMRIVARFGAEARGRLQLIDGLAGTMRPLSIAKDPACRGCGG